MPNLTIAQPVSDTQSTLTIKITDTEGTPLRGASVYITPHSRYGQLSGSLEWTRVPLDSSGRGDAQTTVGSIILVKAQAPGYAPTYQDITFTGRNLVEPVTLTLTKGTMLIGRFRHPEGKTVTSGTVILNCIKLSENAPYGRLGNLIINYEDHFSSAPVQADGTFSFAHVPAGSVRVMLDAPDFALEDILNQVVVGVPEAASHTVEIPVVDAGFVAGAVMDSERNPVPHVYVHIGAGEDDRIILGSARADENGRYRVDSVQNVPYYALVSHPDVNNVYTERSGVNVENVDILYAEPTKAERRTSATAIVIDGAGIGIENYTVEVVDQYEGDRTIDVEYGEASRFRITSGGYISHRAIKVSAPGYAPVTHYMDSNDNDKRFILPKAVRLSGNVIDGITGRGILGAEVRLVENDLYTTKTISDGTFDFPVFPAGFAELDILPPHEYRKNFVQTILKKEDPETSLTVLLTRAGLLKMRVVQLSQSVPVAFEPLEFEGKVIRTASTIRGIGPTRRGDSNLDGTYDHYDSGHPITIALPQRHLKLSLQNTLVPEEVKELTIRLGSSTITIDTGREEMCYFYGTAIIDGIAYEYASDYHRSDYLVATDHAGKAVIRDLPPGQWTFTFVGSSIRPSRREAVWATHEMTVPVQGEISISLLNQ
jgi:hypothetical protein